MRAAAEQGFALAQYNLALMMLQGRGVTRDDGEAALWLERAAGQGLAVAEAKLALMPERP
jgi:TPR repeat protein